MLFRIAALFLLAAPAVLAQQPNQDAILKRVDDHYNRLTSLEAHYSEHYTGMGMDRTESGTLLLKKPGRMRWTYASPAGKLFILDGKDGYFYTPGTPQAQRVSAKQLDDLRSPLRLLLGHTQLKKELENITLQPLPLGGYRISGMPKGLIDRVKNISLDTDAKGLITSMSIEETSGAITSFTFSEMRENIPTHDADFVFTPPAGVTVIDGLPPV
ncbi:MAG TPA: outer membrane lipoprotein carrier protein LolA [Granulicella sp.]